MDTLVLTVRFQSDPELEPGEADERLRNLRREVLESDVQSIELLGAGPIPQGTRAVDAAVIGGLLVTLSHSSGLLQSVVGIVQGWLTRQPGHTIELQIDGDTLKLSGVSSEEQRRLVDVFIARHAQ